MNDLYISIDLLPITSIKSNFLKDKPRASITRSTPKDSTLIKRASSIKALVWDEILLLRRMLQSMNVFKSTFCCVYLNSFHLLHSTFVVFRLDRYFRSISHFSNPIPQCSLQLLLLVAYCNEKPAALTYANHSPIHRAA